MTPHPNARAYLEAAHAAEALGNFSLAGKLKAMAISPAPPDDQDPEVRQRAERVRELNAEISDLEDAGKIAAARAKKSELLRLART